MTFLEAKAELNDLLDLHKSIRLLELMRNDLHGQAIKSPQWDKIGSGGGPNKTDDALINKIMELAKLDDEIKKLKEKESYYIERLQLINPKHSTLLLATYYMDYKLKEIAKNYNYSRSEMSRKLSKSIECYANVFSRPLKAVINENSLKVGTNETK